MRKGKKGREKKGKKRMEGKKRRRQKIVLSASNGSDQTWTSGRRRQGQSINGVKANEQMGEERVDMDMDLDSSRWVGW